ncbi:MAG: hypothetical protein INR65_18865 [Gluconacetobacter diazotrophicus]|nr:hypothetical protein [Gluconacetobacter diazotrophicus]
MLLPCSLRAVDPLSDAAVTALAQLTDPHRLEALSDAAFPAQLGPALGWLHVARRRDVAPEAVIARAFALNGLTGERARLTRESLLRNLARADSWELFAHDDTALALSVGRPAQIPTGIHRGHLAQAAVVVPEGLTAAQSRREFACLVLRADDEMPYVPPPRRRQPGDMIARRAASPRTSPPAARPAARARPLRLDADVSAAPAPGAAPISYDDPLPSL